MQSGGTSVATISTLLLFATSDVLLHYSIEPGLGGCVQVGMTIGTASRFPSSRRVGAPRHICAVAEVPDTIDAKTAPIVATYCLDSLRSTYERTISELSSVVASNSVVVRGAVCEIISHCGVRERMHEVSLVATSR